MRGVTMHGVTTRSKRIFTDHCTDFCNDGHYSNSIQMLILQH